MINTTYWLEVYNGLYHSDPSIKLNFHQLKQKKSQTHIQISYISACISLIKSILLLGYRSLL